MDYEYDISYFGLNFVSPLHGCAVKIERFQIKQNVLNLKSTLHDTASYKFH